MPTSVLSNYLGNAILAEYLQAKPNWLALHIDDPTVTGDLSTEVAGGGYARQASTGAWSAPGSKTVATARALTWVGMPACTVAYIAVWDALTGGHLWVTIALAPPITVPASGHFLCASGDVAVSL